MKYVYAHVCITVRHCSGIPTVRNASETQIITSQDESVDGFGAQHVFSCDEGFTMYGDETVECQANGTWSASPVCKGELR